MQPAVSCPALVAFFLSCIACGTIFTATVHDKLAFSIGEFSHFESTSTHIAAHIFQQLSFAFSAGGWLCSACVRLSIATYIVCVYGLFERNAFHLADVGAAEHGIVNHHKSLN